MSKVQAIDELGRWEEAKVIKDYGEDIEVSFVGWSAAFNRRVARSELRDTYDPFKEEYREYTRFIII